MQFLYSPLEQFEPIPFITIYLSNINFSITSISIMCIYLIFILVFFLNGYILEPSNSGSLNTSKEKDGSFSLKTNNTGLLSLDSSVLSSSLNKEISYFSFLVNRSSSFYSFSSNSLKGSYHNTFVPKVNQCLGLFTFLGLSSYVNNVSHCSGSGVWNWLKTKAPSLLPSIEISGAGQKKVVAQSSDYEDFRASRLAERFNKQEGRCDELWERAKGLEGKAQESVQAHALECTKLQNEYLNTILNHTKTTTVSGVQGGLNLGSQGEKGAENDGVIATSPIIPSFEEGFVFFKFIDFSYAFPYILFYIVLVSFFLQLYLFCCFLKSLFIKEYIFSYINSLKTGVQFSFLEFFIILFMGFLFTFICVGVDVYDRNTEIVQLGAAATNHAVSELGLDVGELKYHYFISLGLKAKSPCELAGTCINKEIN